MKLIRIHPCRCFCLSWLDTHRGNDNGIIYIKITVILGLRRWKIHDVNSFSGEKLFHSYVFSLMECSNCECINYRTILMHSLDSTIDSLPLGFSTLHC